MQVFDKSILFFCYNVSLHRKLNQAGIRFITEAISKDNRTFWLYFRTEEVRKVIGEHNKSQQ